MAAFALKVGGVVPFTATDYPGKLAAVVFVQGCPWRCGYCHNPHLQARQAYSAVAWPEVHKLLARRVGLIDAVVFSGGEPTIDPALPDAVAQVRAMGFEVGLHTACIYPRQLGTVLPQLDWVGFDVKAPFDDYARVTRIADSGRHARACAEMIIASGVAHECRTTVHPDLLGDDELEALAATLAGMGVRNYALQMFRAQGCGDAALAARAVARAPAPQALARIGAMFPQFTLRQAA
ncbi:MAG: anaerobic ribonucleoside-triphosphate reductase activating protein [Pseudomonadota bacterium]